MKICLGSDIGLVHFAKRDKVSLMVHSVVGLFVDFALRLPW